MPTQFKQLTIPDVILVKPQRLEDERGFFVESYNKREFQKAGIQVEFVQDNHSLSRRTPVLRGLHFQRPPHAQAKLVRVLNGAIFDVAVDIRKGSATYGCWVGEHLSADNGLQLFLPEGFAHGFVTLEPNTEVAYKTSAHYAPQADAGIAWDDPKLDIDWQVPPDDVVTSDKDAKHPALADCDTGFL